MEARKTIVKAVAVKAVKVHTEQDNGDAQLRLDAWRDTLFYYQQCMKKKPHLIDTVRLVMVRRGEMSREYGFNARSVSRQDFRYAQTAMGSDERFTQAEEMDTLKQLLDWYMSASRGETFTTQSEKEQLKPFVEQMNHIMQLFLEKRQAAHNLILLGTNA